MVRRINVGIITFPISDAGNIPLSNLVDVLDSITDDLYLITGNSGYICFKDKDRRIHTSGITHESGANLLTRVLKYIYAQLRISYELVKIARKTDVWIFFIGGDSLVLPILAAKLLRKDAVLVFAGSSVQTLESIGDGLSRAVEILSRIGCTLSKRIVLYSENLIEKTGLEEYRSKISIAHKHFLDFGKFTIERQLGDRENVVGYIGRLSEEKGVLNLIKAIPIVLNTRGNAEFLIGGDGQLRNEIREFMEEGNLNSKVKLEGWIPHEHLPAYLNKLKLLVSPSYTEGLPNIMLEAMACGTPVLATPVGAIPDVIKEGDTGFIMEDNSPECIARNVIRVLNHPNLEAIAENARVLVEKEFTYEAAVEKYRRILQDF